MINRAIKMASYFGDVPKESLNYQIKKMRFLVRICYQHQKVTTPEPFSFSWNEVARELKVSPWCAGSYLRDLISDGIIAVVEEHTDTKATKYRYIGGGNT